MISFIVKIFLFLGQTAIDTALTSGYKELASKLAYWSYISSRVQVFTIINLSVLLYHVI